MAKGFFYTMFSREEAELIVKIPIKQYRGADRRMWSLSKRCNFTVRSAHFCALQSNDSNIASTSSPDSLSLFWKSLWSARIPPQIIHFIHRHICRVLPAAAALRKNGVPVDMICA